MLSKVTILSLLLFSAQPVLANELVIISDLDETLRMANVEKHAKAGIKLLAGVKPYEGLSAIFKEIKQRTPNAKFYYLSNSYTFLYNGKKWTKENSLPEGVVFQRAKKDNSDEFKPAKLKEIAKNHPGASYIMFGDNIEKDPVFYKNFKDEAQIDDAQIFIRDARLTFPIETDITYYQTEAQITDDLDMSPETRSFVNGLSYDKLVPKFLLKNLRSRLLKECRGVAQKCTNLVDKRVQEVIKITSPTETSELFEDAIE